MWLTLLLATSPADAAIGDKLADVVRHDYFEFFGWSEAGREAKGDLVVVRYDQRPEAMFRAQVRFAVTVDNSDRIVAMELGIDRAFIGGSTVMFAEDIARSFAREAFPDDPKLPDRLLADPAFRGAMDLHAIISGAGTITVDNEGGWVTIVAGTPPAAAAPSTVSSQSATTTAGWHARFLQADDMPGMSLTQDSRDTGADGNDLAFRKHGGTRAGMAAWTAADMAAPAWRVVDIRWELPSVEAAAKYHADALALNAEGQPEVKGAVLVGDECRVFGGTVHEPILGVDMTHYYYVFRVGTVVAKIYVSGGPTAPAGALTADLAAAVAKKAAARMD